MGASGWHYFTEHNNDLSAALTTLKAQVFSAGTYFDAHRAYPSLRGGAAYSPPKTVRELMARCAEDGTHSILDMSTIAATEDYGVVRPLTDDERLALFGTTTPTRDMMLSAGWEQLRTRRSRGWCTPFYTDAGAPDGLFFWGSSGD